MVGAMQPTQADGPGVAEPPLTPDELAPHLPQFEILECLGRGGMGVVYKARQKSLHRLVALKILAPERADDPQFAGRFEKEARALAALNHPHIVSVHDFGQSGGFYYLVMEFVDGPNLRQVLQSQRLTPNEALGIVPPICEALQCAHDHGIVHCDIKPENLLMDKQGTVKIADFGIAKLVQPSPALPTVFENTPNAEGTPTYAAPEQSTGNADRRSDIYSLGVVLYEMLTGEAPPKGKIEAPSKRTPMDLRVDEIVMRTLQKNPDLRFATAADLRTSIEAILHQKDSAPDGPNAPASALPSFAKRHKVGVLIGSILTCLLAATLTVVYYLTRVQPEPRNPLAQMVDFDAGQLTDNFSENLLLGRSGYAITPLGFANSNGIVLSESLKSEGTLVYKKSSFDLSRLATLQVSCCFKRQGIGGSSHALAIGLMGSQDGQLSGVPGAAFAALRLKVEDETLKFQFMSKSASVGPPRSWMPAGEFSTEVGKWYRLRITFVKVDDSTLRVTGEVLEVNKRGGDGEKVGFFLTRDFTGHDFPIPELLAHRDMWVAIRADGPGGIALLDNFQVLPRPLPNHQKPQQTASHP